MNTGKDTRANISGCFCFVIMVNKDRGRVVFIIEGRPIIYRLELPLRLIM